MKWKYENSIADKETAKKVAPILESNIFLKSLCRSSKGSGPDDTPPNPFIGAPASLIKS